MSVPVVHWDDVEPVRREKGHIGGIWQDLGSAAGSVRVGVKRMRVDAGKWSTPAHAEGAEEEIFFVLGGSGLSWQDGAVYEIRTGDCLVHLPGEAVHTLRAGPEGLEVLAFGMRLSAQIGELPRAGVAWIGPTWVLVGEDPAPWEREVAAGEPEVTEVSPRPPTIVNLNDVPGEFGGAARPLGSAAGSKLTGLNHVVLEAGGDGAPPHCHSAEEELFVVLDGEGTLELTPSPVLRDRGVGSEEHALRAGSVVSRPAGTRMAHSFRAGGSGLTYLAYGTREPNDIAYYPGSNEILFRGVGVIARLEHLDFVRDEQ